MDRKQLHIIREIRKKLKKNEKACLNKNCRKAAINSHLLQQNGILNFIATNNDIIQLNNDVDFDETAFKFQKRSIGKAETLTFKVFCSSCDNKVFESIEKTTPDFNKYKTQLLFSYRAFLRELGAIKFGLEFYSECIACKDLDPQIKAKIAPMKKAYELVLYTYDHFSLQFEKNLKQEKNIFPWGRKYFTFHTFELPRVEVAVSAIFSYEQDLAVKTEEYNLKKPLDKRIASRTKPIFLNIIPRESSSIVIIGYAKGVTRIENKSVNNIGQISTPELLKLLSDILVKRIDNWCVSLQFYEFMKKTGKDKRVIDLKHEYFIYPASQLGLIKEMEIEFNLFQKS